jgi:hypothetical protein
MNYKNYFKQRLFEATFTFPGIFPYQASPDGEGLVPLQPQVPPTNTNPVGPVPANPDRKPELPPGTPRQPPAPRDPNGNPIPGSFGLVPIRMPDGTLRYEWVWVLPGGGGMLIWHPNGYWVRPRNPIGPGTGTIA